MVLNRSSSRKVESKMDMILDLHTVPDTERPIPDIKRPSASVATASTIGPRGDTTSASSSTATSATSVNSEFSEEYQRIKRDQQNRINHEQHRTRTMQRRAAMLSLRHCASDSMIEEHQLSSSGDPGQSPKPPIRLRSLREMLMELDIDVNASHGRYRNRSIDRRPALSVVSHPPFEAGEVSPETDHHQCANIAPELPQSQSLLPQSPPVSWRHRHSLTLRDMSIFGGSPESREETREEESPPTDVNVSGNKRRSSLMDLTLFKAVKESGDDTDNNMEPRLTEPIPQRIRRNSSQQQLSQIPRNSSQQQQLSQIRRNSSQQLSQIPRDSSQQQQLSQIRRNSSQQQQLSQIPNSSQQQQLSQIRRNSSQQQQLSQNPRNSSHHQLSQIRRNSSQQLSQMRRNSSQQLSQLTNQVRSMFTKNAEFDDIARDPLQPNTLLATMKRCESNNLLNALKKFDADDN